MFHLSESIYHMELFMSFQRVIQAISNFAALTITTKRLLLTVLIQLGELLKEAQTMTEEKRKQLKQMIRMNTLAEQSGTKLTYLSRIINNQSKPSAELADQLAKTANQIILAHKLAEIASKLVLQDQFTAQDFLENK